MAEQVVFTGEGRPQKKTLKEWAKKTFTFSGNEEAWRVSHEKELEMMRAINESLPEEKRGEAMKKIEAHVKSSAKLRVIGNYGATIVATAAVVGEGLLIGNFHGWADTLAKKKNIIGLVGKQAQFARRQLERFGRKKRI